jgi:hypothetical protein
LSAALYHIEELAGVQLCGCVHLLLWLDSAAAALNLVSCYSMTFLLFVHVAPATEQHTLLHVLLPCILPLLLLLQVAAEAYVERVQNKHAQLLLRLAWCRWRLDAAAGRVRNIERRFLLIDSISVVGSNRHTGGCSRCCGWPVAGGCWDAAAGRVRIILLLVDSTLAEASIGTDGFGCYCDHPDARGGFMLQQGV